ncbi:MAG: restriction endonuclease subunit S, partial [Bacteroidetes bacterium]
MNNTQFKKYPKYKPSGIEWIGEIPEHWETGKIKVYLENEQNGIWGEEEKGDENDKICIRVADFDREFDKLKKNENTVRNIKPKDFQKKFLKYGDLLIEKSGGGELTPVGRVGYFDWNNVEAVCANFMARLRLIEQNDSRYFFFLFKALYKNGLNLKSIKQTTGIQNLDTYNYFSEYIAKPKSLPEQTAIANYLDDKTAKIDSLIEKKKKLIELYKEERTAVINQAVTRGINPSVKLKDSGIEWLGKIPEHWEVKKLKYVLSIKSGDGIKSEEIDFEGTYPVYGGNGVMGYT